MQKPFIMITLAYTAGLLFGNAFLYFPYSIVFFVILLLLCFVVAAVARKLSVLRALLFTIPGLIGMAAYLYSAAWLPADHYSQLFPDDKKIHHLIGRISSVLDRDLDRIAFKLDVRELDGRAVSGRVRVTVRDAAIGVGYGDVIRDSGRLFRPNGFHNPGGFDYPTYLARSGIFHIVSVKRGNQIEKMSAGTGFVRTVQDLRERIRQAFLTSTTGVGSAILQAMVLGEEGGLTDDMRDRFQAAGVTHIISISGSHLGMMAVLCFGFINMLMRLLPEKHYHRLTISADPKKIAAWLTLPLVIFYTFLAGGQTATVRALVMITAGLAALILDRPNSLLQAVAIAALGILVAAPQALFDISFQLSFLSVFSIGSVVLLWKDLRIEPKGRMNALLHKAGLLAVLSVAASFVTGPLVARYFNQFSAAGLVSNMFVVPFAGAAVVPLGLLSGILSLFTGILPFARLNQVVADLFVRTVDFFAVLPFAEFHPRSPGMVWLLAYAVLIAAVFMVLRALLLSKFRPFEYSSRFPRGPARAVILSFVVLAAACGTSFLPEHADEVWAPDVGQGDATLIRLPGSTNILIDGGGSYDGRFDIGRSVLAPFLWRRGVGNLDLVVLSHPHPDHMNGLMHILKKFEVGQVWSHGLDTRLPEYDRFLQVISDRNIRHKTVSASDPPLAVGGAEVTVLHPGDGFRSGERRSYAAENDRSLVIRIAFRGKTALFTGDIGIGAENFLLKTGKDVRCDLLKAAHHGSRSSSGEQFLAAARPSLVLVHAGQANRYRHPSPEVVDRYDRTGAKVLRTDRDGAISVAFGEKGPEIVRWNDLELQRLDDLRDVSLHKERENWRRLWVRKWEL